MLPGSRLIFVKRAGIRSRWPRMNIVKAGPPCCCTGITMFNRLSRWTNGLTGPFEPTVRDGAIYARGAADDKGQVWAHAEGIAAWQQHGGLPVNLTMLIEGRKKWQRASRAIRAR